MHAFVPNFKFRDVRQDGSLKMTIGAALNSQRNWQVLQSYFSQSKALIEISASQQRKDVPGYNWPHCDDHSKEAGVLDFSHLGKVMGRLGWGRASQRRYRG